MVRSQHLWCLLYAVVKGHGRGGDLWCALSWGVQLKYVCMYLHLLFIYTQRGWLILEISFPVYFPFKWRQNLSARPRTSSTEVKNEWSYTSIPLHAFMARTEKALVRCVKQQVFEKLFYCWRCHMVSYLPDCTMSWPRPHCQWALLWKSFIATKCFGFSLLDAVLLHLFIYRVGQTYVYSNYI